MSAAGKPCFQAIWPAALRVKGLKGVALYPLGLSGGNSLHPLSFFRLKVLLDRVADPDPVFKIWSDPDPVFQNLIGSGSGFQIFDRIRFSKFDQIRFSKFDQILFSKFDRNPGPI